MIKGIKKILSSFILGTFLLNTLLPPSYAQGILNLSAPGTMLTTTSTFEPALIRGLMIYPDNPLKFDFIIDRGEQRLSDEEFNKESTRLIKYFLASLTVPEKDMWVNLSPYEKNRIVPDNFGQTEMGRDLLAQDYLLKQLTASLMYPEKGTGKEFWNRVYSKINERFGTIDIPLNTFNKVWIIPQQASIYEHKSGAFIVNSHLKVMLEEDYVAMEHNSFQGQAVPDNDKSTAIQSQMVREVIIPEIEKEVNEGKTFTQLRQIYNSMILASWYKKALRESLLGHVYVDQNKTEGVDIADKNENQRIYEKYLEAFKQGAYNYVKEDYDPQTQQLISRKYISGGVALKLAGKDIAMLQEKDKNAVDAAILAVSHNAEITTVVLNQSDNAMLSEEVKQILVKSGVTEITLTPTIIARVVRVMESQDSMGKKAAELRKLLNISTKKKVEALNLVKALSNIENDNQTLSQKSQISRRGFIRGALAAGALATAGLGYKLFGSSLKKDDISSRIKSPQRTFRFRSRVNPNDEFYIMGGYHYKPETQIDILQYLQTLLVFINRNGMNPSTASQFRNELQDLLKKHAEMLTWLRQDEQRVRKLLQTNQFDALALETSDEGARMNESDLKKMRGELASVLTTIKLDNVAQVVDDLLLLRFSTGYYFIERKDPLIAGLEILPIDNAKPEKDTFDANKFSDDLDKLEQETSEDKVTRLEELQELYLGEASTEREKILSEMKALFVNESAATQILVEDVTRQWIRYSAFIVDERNTFFLEQLHNYKGKVLFLVGGGHLENLREQAERDGQYAVTEFPDGAMTGELKEELNVDKPQLNQIPGGIDFNSENLTVDVNKSGAGIEFAPISDQQIQDLNIKGFVPVIINVTPAINLPIILGVTNPQKEKPIEVSSI
jgi:hypothetical protein